MITFAPFRAFFDQLVKPDGSKMTRSELREETGLSNDTIQRIFNDGNVRTDTINRLCRTYQLQLSEVIRYTDHDDDPISGQPDYASRPGFRRDRRYPALLPMDLRPHYAYPQTAGHSIMCLIASLRHEWEQANRLDHVVPVAVQYVLSNGWQVDNGWIVVDAPYRLDLHPDIDPSYDEFS